MSIVYNHDMNMHNCNIVKYISIFNCKMTFRKWDNFPLDIIVSPRRFIPISPHNLLAAPYFLEIFRFITLLVLLLID